MTLRQWWKGAGRPTMLPNPEGVAAQHIEGRVYANGEVGVFLSLRADADPASVRYECRINDASLIGGFGNLDAAISFADDFKAEKANAREED